MKSFREYLKESQDTVIAGTAVDNKVAGDTATVAVASPTGEEAKHPTITESTVTEAKATTEKMVESLQEATLKEYLLSSGVDATVYESLVTALDAVKTSLGAFTPAAV